MVRLFFCSKIVCLNLEINNSIGHVFSVRQNDPNPWKTSTTIGYDLPHAGDVKLTITDLSGRIIMRSQFKGETGPNEVIISSDQLHGIKGILIYQIESGSYIAQKKMLLIE